MTARARARGVVSSPAKGEAGNETKKGRARGQSRAEVAGSILSGRMGCCYSKPVPRAREEAGASNGRLRALVERLRPRGRPWLEPVMAV